MAQLQVEEYLSGVERSVVTDIGKDPVVTLFARRYCASDAVGTAIGMTWRVFRSGRLVAVGQQTSRLRPDCTIAARLRLGRPIAKGNSYVATFELNDRNGILLGRHLTIRGT